MQWVDKENWIAVIALFKEGVETNEIIKTLPTLCIR